MGNETTSIRINAKKLGSIQGVIQLLTDIEIAYKSIYAFDFIVETLSHDSQRQNQILENRYYKMRKYWKESLMRKDFPYDPFLIETFWDDLLRKPNEIQVNLLEFQNKIDIDKVILPADRLIVTMVNIQSPGFWEFLGSLNPLQQIREFINDCYERKKDRKYRNRQDEELGELSIIEKKNSILNQRIETLRKLGFSDAEIRQLVMSMVIEPLNRLETHQDRGQIDSAE
jgi:hypothetical protein